MRFAVLGSGTVGRAVAGRLASLGHDVTIGTRDVDALMARDRPDPRGTEPFAEWSGRYPGVGLGAFSDAAGDADVVVNATSGAASLAALEQAGGENLSGKTLIDIANPLDFSHGMPPSLLVSNTDSLAEQIQRAFPDAKVVKALNTVNARVMVDPQAVGGGDHDIFVCGDDAAAKARVTDVLRSFGWTRVIDLGGIVAARAAEMYLPLWLALIGSLRTPMFNIKVVHD